MNDSQMAYKKKKKESDEWGQHRGDRAAQSTRYREQYPERVRASGRLQYAVQTGKIKKPDHCEICLRKGEVEGHHEDYDKPLDVIWVCWSCHNGIHMNEEEVE